MFLQSREGTCWWWGLSGRHSTCSATRSDSQSWWLEMKTEQVFPAVCLSRRLLESAVQEAGMKVCRRDIHVFNLSPVLDAITIFWDEDAVIIFMDKMQWNIFWLIFPIMTRKWSALERLISDSKVESWKEQGRVTGFHWFENWYKFENIAKRHQPSLLFTSLTILTSPILSLDITFITG